MHNICFIPARAGSTRLKNKAIAKFKGGTLVSHTIEQAIRSKIFHRIILSSNGREILTAGKEYGIELHKRSDKLAENTTTLIETLRGVIPELRIEDDSIIALLLVTCPFRSIEDIINAHEIFVRMGKKDTVVSVKKNEYPVQMTWKNMNGRLIPVMPEEFKKTTQKQGHFDTFCFNDAIIIDLAKNFMEPSRNLYGDKPIPYLMSWERSIAIDYEFQLKIAQCLGERGDG